MFFSLPVERKHIVISSWLQCMRQPTPLLYCNICGSRSCHGCCCLNKHGLSLLVSIHGRFGCNITATVRLYSSKEAIIELQHHNTWYTWMRLAYTTSSISVSLFPPVIYSLWESKGLSLSLSFLSYIFFCQCAVKVLLDNTTSGLGETSYPPLYRLWYYQNDVEVAASCCVSVHREWVSTR